MSENTNIRMPLILKVVNNEYKISIPTIGQLWDIEEAKAILSNGRYGAVMSNRTTWAEYNLDNIDMVAHLSIMCPLLMKDLKVEWKDLDPFDFEELRTVYKEQFIPWFSRFTELLRKVKKDESETEA